MLEQNEKKSIKEGAYFKLLFWVLRGSRFRRFGTRSSSALALSFQRAGSIGSACIGSARSACAGFAHASSARAACVHAPTAPELW